ACSARKTVSVVVCAPQCTATWSAPLCAMKSSATRLRSSTSKRTPSPVVPRASRPSTPCSVRKPTYGSKASSSSTAPPPARGVSAAAIVPRSTVRLYRAGRRMLAVSALRVERDGSVLRITLARPDRRNAFDAELIDELSQAFVDVGRARTVVLAGEGASFCAGADVDWMRASVGLSLDENVADANAMRRMFEAIDGCPAPVVARVQGHALGGGAGLVAVADIPICAPDTV